MIHEETVNIDERIEIDVEGAKLSELLNDEFRRRQAELIESTPGGIRHRTFTSQGWADEIGVSDTLLNSLLNGKPTRMRADNLGKLVEYFIKMRGLREGLRVLNAAGALPIDIDRIAAEYIDDMAIAGD